MTVAVHQTDGAERDGMLERLSRVDRGHSAQLWEEYHQSKREYEASRESLARFEAKYDSRPVQAPPEHWFWRWPCWSLMTACTLYFAVHVIVGLLK